MKDLNKISGIFCTRPFEHIYGEGNGIWKLCCKSDDLYFKNYTFDNTTIESWIYSKYLDQLRKDFILGNKSEIIQHTCSVCFSQEKIGLQSDRIFRNNFNNNNENLKQVLQEFISNNFNFKKAVVNKNLKLFDIKIRMLGNYCNLSCFACKPSNSSTKWSELEDYNILNYFNNNTAYLKNKNLIKSILPLLPYVNQIYFNGGEPLLTNDHIELLTLIKNEKLNKDIKIQYSSNLTKITNECLDMWKFFDVKFNVSLDAYGTDNNYIRHNSNWNDIYKNLKLLKYNVSELEICFTTSIINVLNISKYYMNFVTDKMFSNINLDFNASLVTHPDWLSIKILPKELKYIALNKINKIDHNSQLHNIYNFLLQELDNEYEDKWKKAINYIKILDKKRKTCITSICPEYKKYIT